MSKTADYRSTLTPDDASHGLYRVRIFEQDGALPLVIVTNPTPGEAITGWLANAAPQLAAFVAQQSLPSAKGLRWVTRYAASTAEEPPALARLYECSAFAVVAPGQVAYREPPRIAERTSIELQARLYSAAELEALIGQALD